MKLIVNFTKEIPSFVSLIAFIVLNDSSGAKELHLLDLLMNYEKWEGH